MLHSLNMSYYCMLYQFTATGNETATQKECKKTAKLQLNRKHIGSTQNKNNLHYRIARIKSKRKVNIRHNE